MGEVGHGVESAAQHPQVCFRGHLVLQVGVDYLGRPVHGSGEGLHALLGVLVLTLGQLSKVDYLSGTGAEIAYLHAPVLANQNIFDLNVTVDETCLVEDT